MQYERFFKKETENQKASESQMYQLKNRRIKLVAQTKCPLVGTEKPVQLKQIKVPYFT